MSSGTVELFEGFMIKERRTVFIGKNESCDWDFALLL